MKELNLYEKYDQPVVIALGFFDSLHKGHVSIIDETVKVAKEKSCEPSVFTFKNDVSKFLNKTEGVVFTYGERLEKLSKLSIETVIFASFTKELSILLPEEFLNLLFKNFSIKGVVCGKDYTFGYGGKGKVDLLRTFCNERGVDLFVVEETTKNGKKISTTEIKRYLKNGDIESANELLYFKYSISGKVENGRKVGRTLGFPTANVNIKSEKFKIKNGVYKTNVFIDGIKYNALTNYGARPTYGLEEVLTETYLKGFDGDLYCKEITVNFEKFLRDCKKFDSEEELREQLKNDLEKIND